MATTATLRRIESDLEPGGAAVLVKAPLHVPADGGPVSGAVDAPLWDTAPPELSDETVFLLSLLPGRASGADDSVGGRVVGPVPALKLEWPSRLAARAQYD
jgi:hypothetical protein